MLRCCWNNCYVNTLNLYGNYLRLNLLAWKISYIIKHKIQIKQYLILSGKFVFGKYRLQSSAGWAISDNWRMVVAEPLSTLPIPCWLVPPQTSANITNYKSITIKNFKKMAIIILLYFALRGLRAWAKN